MFSELPRWRTLRAVLMLGPLPHLRATAMRRVMFGWHRRASRCEISGLNGVLDPTVVDDHDIGGVPVAVLVQPIIETPRIVIDRRLRELDIVIVRRDADTSSLRLCQFPARLDLSRR